MRKLLLGGFLILGLIVAGFLFLLKGCLSRYDERSAIIPALYIEKNGKGVLFAIVKYAKATSYSKKGGVTSKSVSTTYYIQNNDPVTGAKLGEQKIKHHNDVKYPPVETIGSSAGLAWVLMGELMAFDAFSLEKKADKAIIESKNPALKGKLPHEKRFFEFDTSTESIRITADDGTNWLLDANTLVATAVEKSEPISAEEELENQVKDLQDRFWKSRGSQRDSLRNAVSILRKKESAFRYLSSTKRGLRYPGLSFSKIKSNQDTANGKWLGLYSKSEMVKLSEAINLQPARDGTARRQLYTSICRIQDDGDCKIAREQMSALSPDQYFLQGGFLLDKKTALPVRLQNDGRLIVHKDKIGNEGKMLLSRVDESGKQAWTQKTGLKEWIDWILTRDRLLIFGADNPSLSGDECNVLLSIDLATGKINRFDYFTNK